MRAAAFLLLAFGVGAAPAQASVPASEDDARAVTVDARLPDGTPVVQSQVNGQWFRADADGYRVVGFLGKVEATFTEAFTIEDGAPQKVCRLIGVPYEIGVELGGCRPDRGPVTLAGFNGPVKRPRGLALGKGHRTVYERLSWQNWGSEKTSATGVVVRTKGRTVRRYPVRIELEGFRECGDWTGQLNTTYERFTAKWISGKRPNRRDESITAHPACY